MMNVMDRTSYSTMDVCRITGLTYRQVDYWIRCGVIVPKIEANGSGSRRVFTARQLDHLVAMAEVHRYLLKYVGQNSISTESMQDLAEALNEGRPWLVGIRVDENGEVETGVMP